MQSIYLSSKRGLPLQLWLGKEIGYRGTAGKVLDYTLFIEYAGLEYAYSSVESDFLDRVQLFDRRRHGGRGHALGRSRDRLQVLLR